MRLVSLLLATLATTNLFAAAPARAREVSAVAEVDLGLGWGKSALLGDVMGLTPNLSLYVPFAPDSGLVVEWGLTDAWGSPTAPLASSGLALQNPFLGYRFRLGELAWFTPGVTIPVASITDNAKDRPAQTVASNVGRATFGMHDLWRYLPENLSIVAPLHGGLPLSDDMSVRYTAAAALAIPTTHADPDIDLIIDLDVTWVYDFISLGFGVVWIPTNGGDNTQFSMRVGAELPLGEDAVLEGGVTMNLGGTFDSFSDGGVMGADLGVRFHF